MRHLKTLINGIGLPGTDHGAATIDTCIKVVNHSSAIGRADIMCLPQAKGEKGNPSLMAKSPNNAESASPI